MNLTRLLVMARKEVIQILRDPRSLAIVFLMPVVLVLHTDPQDKRRARSPSERLFLLGLLARVVALSASLRDRLLDGLNEPLRDPDVLPECISLDALRGDVVAAWAAGEAMPK